MVMKTLEFRIRPAVTDDAASVGRLAAQFAQYLRNLGDQSELNFNAEIFLRDGFGPEAAFSGLVADSEQGVIGYLLFHPGYDVDYATRTLHIVDLYVEENSRGLGIGKALMLEASRLCQQLGGTQLFWAVYVPNKKAIAFYERLGGRFTQDLLYMKLDV